MLEVDWILASQRTPGRYLNTQGRVRLTQRSELTDEANVMLVRFKNRSSRKVLQLVTGLQLHGVHSKTTRVYIHNRAELVRKYEMSKYGKFEIPTMLGEL